MAKTTITTKTTEYFATVKTLNDVHEIVVNNLDKLEDADFLKQYKKAYNAHREDRVGKYGRYTTKAKVTADGFIKAVKAIKAITDIRVGSRAIKLDISFVKGGINLHGETKLIKSTLKEMGLSWNPKTECWYGAFYDTLPNFVAIPERVKAETKTAGTRKTNTKVVDFAAKKAAKDKPAVTADNDKTDVKVGISGHANLTKAFEERAEKVRARRAATAKLMGKKA